MLNKQSQINIANAVLFQTCWFIAVMTMTIYAFAAIALVLVVYFYSLNRSENNVMHRAVFLIVFSLVGYLGDSLIAWKTGLIYSRHLDMLAPLWLMVLWLAFATTLKFSMRWIFTNSWLTLFIGLFIAPLSYVAGIHLSNSYFIEEHRYYVFILLEGIWWGVVLLSYKKANEIYEVQHEKTFF
jgi:hypothetical protein